MFVNYQRFFTIERFQTIVLETTSTWSQASKLTLFIYLVDFLKKNICKLRHVEIHDDFIIDNLVGK